MPNPGLSASSQQASRITIVPIVQGWKWSTERFIDLPKIAQERGKTSKSELTTLEPFCLTRMVSPDA